MNKRGQAALEYLMTYGWALIVIAIVVGVLVFIVVSPTTEIKCNTSDPSKILVKAFQIKNTAAAGATIGTIRLTNITGGNMTMKSCWGTGAFAQTVPFGAPLSGTSCNILNTGLDVVSSGIDFELKPNAFATAGTYATSGIGIRYSDYAGFNRDINITCSGPITI
jgi:hypothetical protein